MSIADAWVDLHVNGDRLLAETRETLHRSLPGIENEGRGGGRRFMSGMANGMRSATRSVGQALQASTSAIGRTASRSLQRAWSNDMRGSDWSKQIFSSITKTMKGLLGAFKPKPFLITLAVAGAPQVIASLSAISAQIGTMLAGGLVMLPTAFAVAGAAVAPLVLGLHGLGDAFKNMGNPKKFAAALQSLAPSARQVVLEVKKVAPAWGSMRTAVQQSLFKNIAAEIRPLSDAILPKLRTTLVSVAGGWNSFGKQALQSIREVAEGGGAALNGAGALSAILGDGPKGPTAMTRITASLSKGLRDAGKAVAPLLHAFGVLIGFGSKRLTGNWGKEITNLANKFDEFVTKAGQNGTLTKWVDTAKSSFGDLLSIFGSLGKILFGIGKAASGSSGGLSSIADTLKSITKVMADPAFSKGLSGFFKAAGVGAKALVGALPAVAKALGSVGVLLGSLASTVGPILARVLTVVAGALSRLAPALGPVVAALGGALTTALTGIEPLFNALVDAVMALLPALTPLLPIIGAVIAALAASLVPVVKMLTPILVFLANAFVKLLNFIKPILPIIVALFVVLAATNPIVVAIAAIVLLSKAFEFLKPYIEKLGPMFSAAWGWVQNVVGSVVNWLTNTAWPMIQSFFSWVGAKATWLYNNAIRPAWTWIQAVIGAVGAWLTNTAWPMIQSFFSWVGAKATWLYNNVIKPSFDFIRAVISSVFNWLKNTAWPLFSGVVGSIATRVGSLYKTVFLIYFNLIRTVISSVFNWIRNVGWPIFNSAIHLVGSVTTWLYNNIIKPYFNLIRSVISGVFNWFRNTGLPIMRAAMRGVGSIVSTVWKGTLSPTFSLIKTGVGAVKTAFQHAKDGIETIWNGLKEVAKAPVRFVVSTVFNNGLIAGLNKILPGNPIPKIPLPRGFDTGGFTGNMPWDKIAGVVHGGEYVIRAARTRMIERRSPGLLQSLNSGAIPGYDGGGLVSTIGNVVKGGVSKAADGLDWLKDKAKSAATDVLFKPVKALFNKMLGGVAGRFQDNMFAQVPVSLVKGALPSVLKMAVDAFTSFGGGSAGGAPGGGHGKAGRGWQWQWALIHSLFPGVQMTSNYRPGAHTAGSGALSYHALGRAIDLGGSVAELTKVARWILRNFGASSHDLLYSPLWGNMGIYEGRWYPQPAITVAQHRNHVHWGYDKGGLVPTSYDNGGLLPTGISLVNNGTGRPEPVGHDLLNGGDTHVSVTMNVSVDDLAKMSQLGDFLKMLEMSGVRARSTMNSGRTAS